MRLRGPGFPIRPLLTLELPYAHKSGVAVVLADRPGLAVAQAELGHDPQRGEVLGQRVRLDQPQSKLDKSEPQHGGGSFGRVALTPVRLRKHIADVADASGD